MTDTPKRTPIATLLRWCLQQSAGHRLTIGFSMLLGALHVAASLGFVWVSKLLIDAATGRAIASEERMVALSATLVGLMLGEMIMSLASQYIRNITEASLRNDIRRRIYSGILESVWEKRSSIHSADLLSRLMEDARVVSDVICQQAPQCLVTCLQFAAALAMLCWMSPVLALCIALIAPIFIVISKIYVRRMRRITDSIRHNESLIQKGLQEGLQHQVVVKTLDAEPVMEQRLDSMQSDLLSKVRERSRFSTFNHALVRLGFIGGYLTAFLWSVWHLHTGAITFGTMTAFLQLVARIQNPMSSMLTYVPAFVQSITSAERLYQVCTLPTEQPGSNYRMHHAVGVRLCDVSYRYSEDEPLVLSHMTHDFKPGSRTALMGPTGIGKSTLVKLILALLTPTDGRIELYDESGNILPVSRASRANLVYVPQGNSLLAGTIRQNLLLGDPEADEQRMLDALHIAAADFVKDLPQGLDSPCGELGSGLSEGQCQRIAIARALLREGNVLLLDEFNSSLDSATAAAVVQRICQAKPDATIIFITHRSEVLDFCTDKLTLN